MRGWRRSSREAQPIRESLQARPAADGQRELGLPLLAAGKLDVGPRGDLLHARQRDGLGQGQGIGVVGLGHADQFVDPQRVGQHHLLHHHSDATPGGQGRAASARTAGPSLRRPAAGRAAGRSRSSCRRRRAQGRPAALKAGLRGRAPRAWVSPNRLRTPSRRANTPALPPSAIAAPAPLLQPSRRGEEYRMRPSWLGADRCPLLGVGEEDLGGVLGHLLGGVGPAGLEAVGLQHLDLTHATAGDA